MKQKAYTLAALGSIFFSALSAAIAPEEALLQLQKGNARFVANALEHPNRTEESRAAFKSHQTPFAVVVGCSDSRVAPEILFDQGIGDLFVVRVAGNVVGPVELDSIDYACVHLGANMILVLGHEQCGAVKAVMADQTADIATVASMIEPAIKGVGDNVEKAIKANVDHVVDELQKTPHIAKLIQEKKVIVVGGYYNFESGKVEFFKVETVGK